MRYIATGFLLAAMVAPAAWGQSYSTGSGGNVCLRTDWIDHTKSPDDRTILFYMKDHKVWATHLKSQCPELSINGFGYVATPPEDICGGLETIRVIRTGAVCMMGPFVPYVPAAAQAAPATTP